MCVNSRYVYNKYSGRSILVACGHCPACEQMKSLRRAERIRNESSKGYTNIVVTLTYDNHYVPYIKQSDLQKLFEPTFDLDDDDISIARHFGLSDKEFDSRFKMSIHYPSLLSNSSIPVYRDYDVRQYKGVSYSTRLSSPVGIIFSSDLDIQKDSYIPILNKKRGCMGVILYSDAQKFMKRLRINIKRFLGDDYAFNISYWCVSEYGGKKHRPHFHFQISFPKGTFEELRPVIAQSWLYGDMYRSSRRIEIAKNAAQYLSEYFNKSVALPKICKSPAIRQKCSHSVRYGHDIPAFSLDSILSQVEQRTMCYRKQVFRDGVPQFEYFPIPQYIINRFFPLFKGYSRFADYEVHEFLLHPLRYYEKFSNEVRRYPSVIFGVDDYIYHPSRSKTSIYRIHLNTSFTYVFRPYNLEEIDLGISNHDFHAFCVRLEHAIDLYRYLTGKTVYDYVIDYTRVWNIYHSYLLKHSFDDVSDFSDFYSNFIDFVTNPSISLTLDPADRYTLDPNKRKDIVKSTSVLHDMYVRRQNIKHTNQLILSELYDDM